MKTHIVQTSEQKLHALGHSPMRQEVTSIIHITATTIEPVIYASDVSSGLAMQCIVLCNTYST